MAGGYPCGGFAGGLGCGGDGWGSFWSTLGIFLMFIAFRRRGLIFNGHNEEKARCSGPWEHRHALPLPHPGGGERRSAGAEFEHRQVRGGARSAGGVGAMGNASIASLSIRNMRSEESCQVQRVERSPNGGAFFLKINRLALCRHGSGSYPALIGSENPPQCYTT